MDGARRNAAMPQHNRVLVDPLVQFVAVQKFRFGADIQASDGLAGRLVAVVAGAPDGQIPSLTHVGIKVHRFQLHVVFVALDRITSATAETITLSMPRDELELQALVPSGRLLTNSTSVNISNESPGDARGRPRENRAFRDGKRLGHLVQLTIAEQSGRLGPFVVARRWHPEVLVLAEMITALTARQINIHQKSLPLDHQHRHLPQGVHLYRTDEELRQQVHDKLYDNESLRVDLPGIEIRPSDGVVWLQGYVSNDSMRRLAGEELEEMTGLSQVHNELVADSTLSAAVSLALADDLRTAGPGQYIGVYPRLGEIHLRGSVQTATVREEASVVAAAVPSVKRVVNELHIDPAAHELADMAGVTNQQDLVPGGH